MFKIGLMTAWEEAKVLTAVEEARREPTPIADEN